MTTHTLTVRLIHIAPSKKPNANWVTSGSKSESHRALADELYEYFSVHHDAFATATATFGGKLDTEYYLGKVTVGRESTGRAACNMTIAFCSLPARIPPGHALLAIKATDVLARKEGLHTIDIQVDDAAESAERDHTTSFSSGAIILASQEDQLDQRLNRVLNECTHNIFPRFISPLRECVRKFELQGLLLDAAQTNVVRLPPPAVRKTTVRGDDRSVTPSLRNFWLSILLTAVVTAVIAALITWCFWSYRVGEGIVIWPEDIKDKLSEIRMEKGTLDKSNKKRVAENTNLKNDLQNSRQETNDLKKKVSELEKESKQLFRKNEKLTNKISNLNEQALDKNAELTDKFKEKYQSFDRFYKAISPLIEKSELIEEKSLTEAERREILSENEEVISELKRLLKEHQAEQ